MCPYKNNKVNQTFNFLNKKYPTVQAHLLMAHVIFFASDYIINLNYSFNTPYNLIYYLMLQKFL